MSKEPIKPSHGARDELNDQIPPKKDEPAPTPQSDEGTAAEDKYHGYTPAQIARIEAEKNPPDPVPSEASAAVKPAPKDEPAKAKDDDDDDDDDKKGKRR
jgi:hypothetical protein